MQISIILHQNTLVLYEHIMQSKNREQFLIKDKMQLKTDWFYDQSTHKIDWIGRTKRLLSKTCNVRNIQIGLIVRCSA